MPDWTSSSTYSLSAVAVGALLLAWTLVWLRRVELDRSSRLRGRTWFEGTKTGTRLVDPAVQARLGLENIRRSTTVIRRALVPTIIVFTLVLAAIPFMGELPTALVSVVVAIVTVTTGIAARPIIENTFAGLVISFSKLVNLGDTVLVDDLYGTVEDVTLTHTTVRLWDWRRYVVPNSKMMQSSIINYSLHDRFQWAYVEFHVAADADLALVERLSCAAAESSEHFAPHEPPRFWVMELGERGVVCWVAGWADTPSSAWALKHDMRMGLAKSLQEHGIAAHGYRVAFDGEPPPTPRPAP